MTAFKILWVIDAIAALIVLYFFFIGTADGSVSPRNIGLWMGILISLAVIMGGSLWLRHSHPGKALSLLSVLAIPALLYLLFILVAVFGKGKWN